jgi:iron complex transport system ATP-binding protein
MIEVKDLTCGYGSLFSLKDINLKVDSGEMMGVIGPNGSGKTTLLRAITRVLRPKTGAVYFDGRDIWRTTFRQLSRRMAVVSQGSDITPMTVEEFVLLGRTPYLGRFQFFETKKDAEAAERAMALTGISGLKDRDLLEMSGGERQLAVMARAIAQEPALLLLDEPTAHLDIAHQVVILDLIKKLNKELGITIIVILHDLNLASEYCGCVALINEGRIFKVGSPQEVLTYQIIEAVYKTVVVVEANPVSSKPYVLIVSGEERRKGEYEKKRIDTDLHR